VATRRSRRSVTVIGLLLVTALALVAFSESGTGTSITSSLRSAGSTVLSPIVDAVNAVTKPIGQFFAGAINYGSVSAENAKLRAQLSQVKEQGLIQRYERSQLAQIAKLQHLTFASGIQTVTAQMSSLDQSNFASTIEISKGRDQGVGLGMPVVGAGGLVGQIVATTRNSSTVRLITDGRTHIGASFGTAANSLIGVVNGIAANRPLSVSYVAPHSEVATGTIVYTNGLQGAQYPAGLPIGKVTSATTPTNAVQMSISLDPMANLDELGFVDVLLWTQTP
jgi:rod shape-determining protein MreC